MHDNNFTNQIPATAYKGGKKTKKIKIVRK